MTSSMSYRALEGGYQELPHGDDDAPPQPGASPGEGLDLQPDVHIAGTEGTSAHIPDLDNFFRKIYAYHQRHGFTCMLVQDVFALAQHVFLVVFIVFLFSCVDYPILFRDKPVDGRNTTEHVKVKLKDGIIPPGQCIARLSRSVGFFFVIWIIYVIYKLAVLLKNLCSNLEIRRFYSKVLRILPGELDNMTWHDVLQRLLEAQRQGDYPIAVHKQELNELDVYHRILRHDNYLVALVNKNVLPLRFNVPFIGTVTFFSSGLKYNIQMLLFWGLWSPFENNWNLRDDYRRPENTPILADEMARRFLSVGLLNLVCMPFIFIYHLFETVFSYADMVKREPGFLGARTWSGYSRVHLRHFNELEHELDSRLCMGYRAATQYMNAFTTHLTVILAKNIVFFAASPWVVLVALTIWDEDFLAVEHIVTAIAILSMILAICRSAIPDEHMIWCPEQLMRTILSHIHYMPDEWQCHAHTTVVRDEFGNLFTYKFTHLLSEVLSAVVTPLLLLGPFRSRSREIVCFFIENSISIEGVGDVCTFAQMDIEKHGNPQWTKAAEPADESTTEITARIREPHPSKQGEMGKTELSLARFHLSNPHWNPDSHMGQRFLQGLKSQIDATALGQYTSYLATQLQPFDSTSTITAGVFHGQPQGQLLSQSVHSYMSMNPMMSHVRSNKIGDVPLVGPGITSAQGPLTSITSLEQRSRSIENSAMTSLLQGSLGGSVPGGRQHALLSPIPSAEQSSLCMSASALFLYEKHQPSSASHGAIGGYGSHGTPRRTPSRPLVSGLANIQESRLETTPLLLPQTQSQRSGASTSSYASGYR
ncbi:autophagy-related protein 9A-like isoform X1 [Varroa destructor]|uniref:Autophagy-related protein 9 n=1 Tax=Varroa destructor TaxID=109461 RepID=A0A7M7KNG2_VARDE|nr:autophagy-related protein 9A-like isoform X1 [Varroa destructor]